MKRMIRKGLFGVATTVALGFGATQALAAPDEAGSAGRRACDPWRQAQCMDWCQSQGYDAGECNPFFVGGCRCWFF